MISVAKKSLNQLKENLMRSHDDDVDVYFSWKNSEKC